MPRAKEKIDKRSASELSLYIDNLLRNNEKAKKHYYAIAANLTRKIASGKYRKKLAIKLALYLVDNAAKSYYHGDYYPNRMAGGQLGFNKRTRMYVASKIVKEFEREYRMGAYRQYIPKKYKGATGIKRLANCARLAKTRRRKNPTHGTKIGEYRGCSIYVNLSGTALSCPSLKLFGFAYDTNLKRAIDKELAKKAKRTSNPRRRRNSSEKFKLVDEVTGKAIRGGQTVINFRGEPAIVIGFDPPRHSASSGRIYVKVNGREESYYPSVYGAEIVSV